MRPNPRPCSQDLDSHRQRTQGTAGVALVAALPQALLMKVVAMPVFPERPVRPIRCTAEREQNLWPTAQGLGPSLHP